MTVSVPLDLFGRAVRERLFAPSTPGCRRVGLEIEMLPLLADSGAHCPLEKGGGEERSMMAFVRAYGTPLDWRERRSVKGAPYFLLPNGWTLTFEPGGQVELCTMPSPHLGRLLTDARDLVTALRAAAADAGIALTGVGIDPHNEATAVPLEVPSDRYVKMTRYFDRIGPFGVRMMRQTAAIQVSVDGGADPGARWRLLADASPYLTALFANSPRYAGRDTGHRSFRERCWRLLDPSRTGVPHPGLSPCESYTRFALDAVDMSRTTPGGEYRSFADWAAEGEWSEAQWENHLSTLFPEVRPRGHLEVRSIDALPPELVTVPAVLVAGLVYDAAAALTARSLVGTADEDLLNRAASRGLSDDEIGSTAADLSDIALAGARRLGEVTLPRSEIERAEEFVRDYTVRRRSPADDR